MTIFAIILLILCFLVMFGSIIEGRIPLIPLTLAVFFTLYLMGY